MPETILIIEDDPLQADVVRLLLEHNGFEVILAGDGAEGLRKLYDVQPDLVILDLILPHMDGWVVCRRIPEMSTVPIIIMTRRRNDSSAEIFCDNNRRRLPNRLRNLRWHNSCRGTCCKNIR